MRSILFLLLFCPFTIQAQRFDISAQGGYSTSSSIALFSDQTVRSGFSSHVSAGVYCTRHILLHVFYEANKWEPNYNRRSDLEIGRNHSFGIAPDFTSKYFFAGVNLQFTQLAAVSGDGIFSYKYDRAFTYGLHAGGRQRIVKHLSLIEYIGCSWLDIKGKSSHEETSHYPPYASYTAYGDVRAKFRVYSFRIGLAYDINFKKKKK